MFDDCTPLINGIPVSSERGGSIAALKSIAVEIYVAPQFIKIASGGGTLSAKSTWIAGIIALQIATIATVEPTVEPTIEPLTRADRMTAIYAEIEMIEDEANTPPTTEDVPTDAIPAMIVAVALLVWVAVAIGSAIVLVTMYAYIGKKIFDRAPVRKLTRESIRSARSHPLKFRPI